MFTVQTYLRPDTLVRVVEQFAEDFFLGEDPTRLEYLYHKCYNSAVSHNGELTKAAIYAGLEMACWDIMGKAAKLSLPELLGGRFREKVRTYSYISAPADKQHLGFEFWQDSDAVAERAAELVDQGFTALKLDPFPLLFGSDTHDGQPLPVHWSQETLDHAVATVERIRVRVGQVGVIIGTHGQMTAGGAIEVAKRLEPFRPMWLEEPVPPELTSEMAKVAKATSIPITSGERLLSKWDFARLIRDEAVSIVNPDLSQVGLLEGRKIAAIAEANYIKIAPHVYGGPLVCAASVQFGATVPNLLITEGMGRFTGPHADLLDEPIQWCDGYAHPSTRPGLGYNLNEDLARAWAPTPDTRLWGNLDAPPQQPGHNQP